MDDAEREDILNDALELFGGEKVDDSGVIMYGPLRLSVAQKVAVVVLLMSPQKPVIALTSPSSSKAKCVPNFQAAKWPWSAYRPSQRITLEHRQTFFLRIKYSLQHSF